MREYAVVYEYVAVRASPSLRAPTLDFLRQGAVVHAVAPPDEDRWIRLHVDEERRKKYGGRKDAYMLTDGAVIGLPLLLKPVEDEETTKRKEKVGDEEGGRAGAGAGASTSAASVDDRMGRVGT